MPTTTIDLLIEGGKATAGAKLGTTLGPMKLNVGDVVDKINEETKDFAGVQVPVKVIVDTVTKEFSIEVGSPPASQLILKELKVKKGSGSAKEEKIGDLTTEQLVKVAKSKMNSMLSYSLKNSIKEIAGTCVSMGVTINNQDPRQFIEEVNEGKHDKLLK